MFDQAFKSTLNFPLVLKWRANDIHNNLDYYTAYFNNLNYTKNISAFLQNEKKL